MSIHSLRLSAATGALALLAVAVPSALAAPASDGQGYLDSTARCASPSTAVAFGSTESSRVAICKTSGGQLEYRGVRVRDGAKLILSASQSGDGAYVAGNDGVTYTVTSSALVVKAGQTVLRTEPWVDFHGSTSSKAPTTTPGLTTSSAPSTSSPPSATSAPAATPTVTTPTVTTPLPPPLPAEVGGSAGR
ncbi:MAG: hypothetical protein E6Q57_09525 [Mycobacterium sp.]|nr:MAG: hypothetical protein E6Q57_09525 [Mycobacterium sp.]